VNKKDYSNSSSSIVSRNIRGGARGDDEQEQYQCKYNYGSIVHFYLSLLTL
jgi:hypothetical protein